MGSRVGDVFAYPSPPSSPPPSSPPPSTASSGELRAGAIGIWKRLHGDATTRLERVVTKSVQDGHARHGVQDEGLARAIKAEIAHFSPEEVGCAAECLARRWLSSADRDSAFHLAHALGAVPKDAFVPALLVLALEHPVPSVVFAALEALTFHAPSEAALTGLTRVARERCDRKDAPVRFAYGARHGALARLLRCAPERALELLDDPVHFDLDEALAHLTLPGVRNSVVAGLERAREARAAQGSSAQEKSAPNSSAAP